MRVAFIDNLGSNDAGKFGLNFAQCTKGAELNVSDELGEKLVKKRFAIEVSAKEVKAVPVAPAIAQATQPAIKSESKPAPLTAKVSKSDKPSNE